MIGDIHLSWSPLQLYMAIVVLFVAGMIALHAFRDTKRYVFAALFAAFFVVGFSAFDVGTRQAELGRHKFDAKNPDSTIDKVESTHNTAASINSKFIETQKLKETK